MYEQLLKKIKEFDQICIFKHVSPDGDCMFSNLALYHFLKDNFKDKKIKVVGKEEFDLINKTDKASDKFISESLCIVLDTSTINRIDDARALNGKFIIKIDHHPFGEDFANLSYVNIKASAACELLTEILLSKEFSKYSLSKKVCEYLYCGLVTDTLNFRTTNVTPRTLYIASKLAEIGELKVAEIVEFTMDKSLDEFNQRSRFRNELVVDGYFGYVKLDKKALKRIGTDYKGAKNFIEEIGCIKELRVWCVATQAEDNKYEISLRSKREYIVNQTAIKYGGGGHSNAAGAKGLNNLQLNDMFEELKKIANGKPKKQ